jgi:hypothetical protein
MTFTTINTQEEKFVQLVMHGGQVRIFAQGDIEEDTADTFKAFVRSHQIENAIVELNSPGGSLVGGLNLGAAIRDLGFDTEIEAKGWGYGRPGTAVCASACAYAFAGGVNRYFSDGAGRLGLHQFYFADETSGGTSDAQSISAVLVAYLNRMGVDATAFALASVTKSDDVLWLSTGDAEKIGLANNGVRPTTAEIKVVKGLPYLKLEQETEAVTARVILLCTSTGISLHAGIVTTPELSSEHEQWKARSYLEFDDAERFIIKGGGATANQSVLWLDRDLSAADARDLLNSSTMSMWVENGGPMRWGAIIDLKPVRERIEYFLGNCQ